MRTWIAIGVAFLTAGCSLLDRQGSPRIGTLRTSRGEKPTVGRGKQVTLTITATDPDNDELDFVWTAVPLSGSARSGGTFVNPRTPGIAPQDTLLGVFQDTISVIWQAPATPDTYLLRVRLSDGRNTLTDSLTVDVTQRPPTALAGRDTMILYADGRTVPLNGNGSRDPDEDDLTYIWLQLSGPSVLLTNERTASPAFRPPAAGDYRFRLRVFDGADSSNAASVLVRVSDRGG